MVTLSAEEARVETGRRERLLLLLAAVFVWLNATTLSLALTGRLDPLHLLAPAVWLVVVAAGHLLLHRYKPGRDPYLFPLVSLMMGWGLVLQDRLAPNFLWRQLAWFALGTMLMVAVAIVPRSLRWLRQYRYTWLTLGLVLLAATLLFGVNPAGSGAALWLQIPFLPEVYFQPSELLKLLLIVFLASYFDDREHMLWLGSSNRRRMIAYLTPLLLMWGFCILLLVWQRDLGAATLFFVSFLALLYLATGSLRYLLAGFVMLLLAGIIGYFAFNVVALRVDTWLNPWPEANDRAFQIVQSLYALGSGGIFGEGPGQGFPDYIPVVHSDFIFAAVAEEWGLIGSLAVLASFALLAGRGMRIAGLRRRAFHVYLAAGITILLTIQAFLIIAGVTRLLPLTGITLPFFSYGGSSMLVSCLMIGLLLYLSAPDERVPL